MPERAPGLTPVRLAIDGVDDGLVLLLATRAQLAKLAGRLKARAGVAGRDDAREQRVRQRAETLGTRMGLAPGTASGVLGVAIGEACRAQGLAADLDQGARRDSGGMISRRMRRIPCCACSRRRTGSLHCCAWCRHRCRNACWSGRWPRCWLRR